MFPKAGVKKPYARWVNHANYFLWWKETSSSSWCLLEMFSLNSVCPEGVQGEGVLLSILLATILGTTAFQKFCKASHWVSKTYLFEPECVLLIRYLTSKAASDFNAKNSKEEPFPTTAFPSDLLAGPGNKRISKMVLKLCVYSLQRSAQHHQQAWSGFSLVTVHQAKRWRYNCPLFSDVS